MSTAAPLRDVAADSIGEDRPIEAWREFASGPWQSSIDVRDFIQRNYQPYDGDAEFLAPATDRTERLWSRLRRLLEQERNVGGVLDADTTTVSSVASHGPGYIEQELEQIVGLQTDAPLKRALMPYGGRRIAQKALQSHGREMDPATEEIFVKHRKTHNDGVFDAYTPAIRRARSAGVITWTSFASSQRTEARIRLNRC